VKNFELLQPARIYNGIKPINMNIYIYVYYIIYKFEYRWESLFSKFMVSKHMRDGIFGDKKRRCDLNHTPRHVG